MAREEVVIGFKSEGGGKVIQETERLTKGLKDLRRQAVETRGALVTLGRIVVPALMLKASQEVIKLADAYTNLRNKVRLVTDGQGALNYVTEELVKTANASRTSLESVATVYTRTARAVAVLGKSQYETLQFTRTLSKAIAIGGSTAVEASNAMIQLSQGLSSGTLRGDELRSVLEQLPVVADLIAKKMGVTIGELRRLGAAGKLTSKQVFEAIVAGAAETDAKFSTMKVTFAQAMEVLKNQALVASQAVQGHVGKLSDIILSLANNFDMLTKAASSAALVLGVIFGVKAISAAVTGINLLAAAIARTPFGAMVTGIALVVAAMAPWLSQMDLAGSKMATMKDAWDVMSRKFMESVTPMGKALEEKLGGKLANFKETVEGFARLLDFMTGRSKNWSEMKDAFGLHNDQEETFEKKVGDYYAGRGDGLGKLKYSIEAQAERRLWREQEAARKAKKARDDAFVADLMPGAHPVTKQPVQGEKASGKSAADLIRELREAIAVLRAPSTEERNIQKLLEATLDQLGKNQRATPGQKSTIERLIRIQENLKEGLKISEEMSKHVSDAMNKAFEERRANDRKMSDEAGKNVSEGMDAAALARIQENEGLRRQIDPRIERDEKIRALEDFKVRNKGDEDMLRGADREIAKLSVAYQAFEPIMDGVSTSIADAAANALIFGDNMEQSLERIAKSLASQVISTGLQLAMGGAVQAIGGPKLFASGGYTGNVGTSEPAGIVHGREFVVNANATARHRGVLEAINKGQSIGGGGAPNINVHNYGGADVEVNQIGRDEIEIMIRKGVKQHAPGAVADDMRGYNSKTNKALKTSYETRARR